MKHHTLLSVAIILLELVFVSSGLSQSRERRVELPTTSSKQVVLITSNLPPPESKKMPAPVVISPETAKKKTPVKKSADKKPADKKTVAPPNSQPLLLPPVIIQPGEPPIESRVSPNSKNEKLYDNTLGGSMTVDVSENGNTLIKIGLAERAVAVIDFPFDDPVYKIHPGNENFVTVGCFGREANGKCLNSPTDAIVLRPGKDFHALGSEESAATVITIQRVSGIVVTLMVVPVKTIAENTNYVAVRYILADVLKNRRERGLAVNLLQVGATLAVGSQNTADKPFDLSTAETAALTPESGEPVLTDDPEVLQKALVEELNRVGATNAALKFSKPVYGISLARASNYSSRVKDITIEVVAVRNTTPSAIRLVPEQPTLAVENKDSKDISINVEPVALLFTASTISDAEILEPGRIYYFAFAYRSPILGVRQSLRVNFAQREASDVPATMELSASRGKSKN